MKQTTYTNKKDLLNDMKQDVLRYFRETDYKEDDKINVSLHYCIDTWVSYISIVNKDKYITFWDKEDFKTIDKGLLPENFNPFFDENHKTILIYCLIEQDLYNDKEINALNEVEQ